VLNQHCGYWLLKVALENEIKVCVKLTNERLEPKIWMNFIPPFQFDAKFLFLISNMQLEVICVFAPFLDCLHQFDPKKVHMMVGFNA